MIGLAGIHRVQDRLIRLLGSSVEGRGTLVAGMLRRDVREETSYWLQFLVSVGMATLGLVVGSSAVIIGAMLVAPLMGPIVGLAMGLATGSPFLVLRSGGRVAISVAVGVAGAALITVLVPFHQLNAEIEARTAPTVLDLLIATSCALAGVYASLRPGSETAATAAGTSIGISLVPPLCASGYGVGTASLTVAGGAALLFVTNLVAIVVVGTAVFVVVGFTRVDVATLEREELTKDTVEGARVSRAVSRRLARIFDSKAGPFLRFLMPFALLAGLYVPLRRALDEVTWQVRVRAAVQQSIDHQPVRVLQSQVRVERHTVAIRLVVFGSTSDADAARARLDAEVRQVSGVVPRLDVVAVADPRSLASLESTFPTPPVTTPAVPPPSPEEQLERGRALVRGAVLRQWPATTVGETLAIQVGAADTAAPMSVRVVHIGVALSPDGTETLRRALEGELKRPVTLIDAPIPSAELGREDGDLALVSRVATGVRASTGLADVSVCVVQPAPPPPGASHNARDVELAVALDDALAAHGRVTRSIGREWRVRFVRGECPSVVAEAADAGVILDARVPPVQLDGAQQPPP